MSIRFQVSQLIIMVNKQILIIKIVSLKLQQYWNITTVLQQNNRGTLLAVIIINMFFLLNSFCVTALEQYQIFMCVYLYTKT